MINEIPGAHIVETEDDGGSQFPPHDDIVSEKTGDVFNPDIHVSRNGEPVLNKDGSFRKKPGMGSPNAKRTLNYPGGSGAPESAEETPELSPQMSLAAESAAAIYINTGVVFFGAEWLPDRETTEKEELVAAFEQYLLAKGITDIPPGLALAITMFGYAAKRFERPQTKTRLTQLAYWAHYQINRFRRKGNGPRDDLGTYRMRENNASETDGSKGWFKRRSGSGS